MILIAAVMVIAATVPLFGGRFHALQVLRLRRCGLLFGALAIQLTVLQVLSASLPVWTAAALHLASYVLALIFIWSNRRTPGLALAGLGGSANFVAISANGGVMPASASATSAAGIVPSNTFENSTVVHDARLPFLGDIFAWPEPLPFANVFSIGDVLLVAGAALLLYRATGCRLRIRQRPVPAA